MKKTLGLIFASVVFAVIILILFMTLPALAFPLFFLGLLIVVYILTKKRYGKKTGIRIIFWIISFLFILWLTSIILTVFLF